MRVLVGLALLAVALAGCTSYSADLNFVRAPGLGYRNAGLYTAGYLFLWDTRQNTLTKLQDDIPFVKQAITESPTTLVSTDVKGISISGGFETAGDKFAAEAALGRKIEFRAEKAVREKYQEVYTALARAYRDGIAHGDDMRRRWFVNDVTRRGSGLYYVVITGLVRADKTSVSFGGESGNEIGSVSVTIPGGATPIKVSVKNSSLVECTGQQSPCFFDAAVLSGSLASNGNLTFDPARVNTDPLSEAFRKL